MSGVGTHTTTISHCEIKLKSEVKIRPFDNADATCSSVTSSHPDYVNLIGYWKGNNGSGNSFTDSSSKLVNLPFANTPTWTTSTASLKCGTATGVVPKMVDIAYSSLQWFGVPINSGWALDGRSWLPAGN